MLEVIEHERGTRLNELAGRDQVSAQHELFTASFVAIEPDPRPVFDQVRGSLTPSMFAQFERMCVRISPTKLTARRAALQKRRVQLIELAKKHRFQIELATSIADALIAAFDEVDVYSPTELQLLNGAVEYFLELGDDAHDLKDPNGFEDDAQVARSVLEVLGRAELATGIGTTAARA
jgi:hypothetical protein